MAGRCGGHPRLVAVAALDDAQDAIGDRADLRRSLLELSRAVRVLAGGYPDVAHRRRDLLDARELLRRDERDLRRRIGAAVDGGAEAPDGPAELLDEIGRASCREGGASSVGGGA